MLGLLIDDPTGVEGEAGETEGLGYLSLVTELKPNKVLRQVSGQLSLLDEQAQVKGYEIHCGISRILNTQQQPVTLEVDDELLNDGILSSDGQVLGTYLHGLFDSPEACSLLLKWAGLNQATAVDINGIREEQLNRFADQLAQNLDIAQIESILARR